MTHTQRLLLVGLVFLLASPVFARKWTDSSGVFGVEAELVSVKNEKVYLEKSDGTVLSVPLDRLSKEDLRYLASLPECRSYFEAHPLEGIDLDESDGEGEGAPAAETPTLAGDNDAEVGEVRRFGDLGWSVTSLVFSPDGRFLAAGKSDRAILMFDVDKSRRVAFVESKYLLSGGLGKVNLWEAATQRKVHEFDTAGTYYVKSIACAPDNRHFAAIPGSAGQELQVFRLPAEVVGE